MLQQKSRSVPTHDFGLNPRPDVPRSVFGLNHRHVTTIDFSYLYPVLTEEVLPGDTWKCGITTVARTAVPIVPVQDNWHLEFFHFFVPMRLLWPNARKFWGEQDSPGDSTAFTIPTLTSAAGGFPVNSLYDYMGLPTVGQVGGGNTITVNCLPFRAYNLTWNQWFRDENLQNWTGATTFGDGPDLVGNFSLKKRGKRFDYITQALPWPQKGNTAISVPLGTSALVYPRSTTEMGTTQPSDLGSLRWRKIGVPGTLIPAGRAIMSGPSVAAPQSTDFANAAGGLVGSSDTIYPVNLYADLTNASAATINTLRTAITLQQYLERDARGGTRYTEFVFNHFGVKSPDARLQRPEFLGHSHAPILTTAIPQTSATGLTGGTTPAGNLAATGHASAGTGFTYSATEHGFLLTLVSARADITYSQMLRKMWSRSTRYDYPVPLLANLGEQALLNKEVYCDGSANDNNVFGYIPRWDEYRHIPSKITGLQKPRSAGNIAYWNSTENFLTLPALNATFIEDNSETVLQRNFAAGGAADNQQLILDMFFEVSAARALPAYGIPGLTRI